MVVADNAEEPIAILFTAEELAANAEEPIATLFVPAVLLANAEEPIAILVKILLEPQLIGILLYETATTPPLNVPLLEYKFALYVIS